jgi:hypothetical protein
METVKRRNTKASYERERIRLANRIDGNSNYAEEFCGAIR